MNAFDLDDPKEQNISLNTLEDPSCRFAEGTVVSTSKAFCNKSRRERHFYFLAQPQFTFDDAGLHLDQQNHTIHQNTPLGVFIGCIV